MLQETQTIRENVQQTPEPLESLLSSAALEKNLAKTLNRIEQDEGGESQTETKAKSSADNVVEISRWRRDWRAASTTVRRLVIAQAACLMAVITLLVINPTTAVDYTTLSEPQPQAGGSVASGYQVYRLMFHPATTEVDIRNLMGSVEGQIISGPSASGVYNVAVLHNDQQGTLVLDSLRRSPWVRLAEPAVHRDGVTSE